MKHSLYLTVAEWNLISHLMQAGIDGEECIDDDAHLERVEYLLKKINQVIILADDFYIE